MDAKTAMVYSRQVIMTGHLILKMQSMLMLTEANGMFTGIIYRDYLQGYNLADEKKNKTNNCKVSFDEEIRRLYIEIAEKYGVIIEKRSIDRKKALGEKRFYYSQTRKENREPKE